MSVKPFKFAQAGHHTRLEKPWHRDAFIDASHRIARLGYCEWDYPNGCIISCTPHYAEIFGMSIAEVIDSQSSWEKVLLQLHPDDRERYARSHDHVMGQGMHEIEYRAYRKDGALRHIREVGIVFFDEAGEPAESMGLLQDITEQKERMQDLENRDAVARQVESITDIGHYIWDIVAERYRYMSQGYARILGVDREAHQQEITSLDDYLAFVHDDDRQRLIDGYLDNLETEEDLVIEYRLRRSDGDYRWVRETSTIGMDSARGGKQAIGVIQDITEHKLSEQLLLRAKDSLEAEVAARTQKLSETVDRLNREIGEREAVSSELEARNAELERFTYTVSHDLKSPLVTLKGFLGLLEKDLEANDRMRITQDIEKLKSATDTMGMLLNDLLELSRVGRVIGETVDCSLTGLARSAVEMVRADIDDNGIEVVVEQMPEIHADESRLVEVFVNLIENAIKFRGQQSAPSIRITAEPLDGMICCSVSDNGIGIAEQFHGQVFGLFERLDAQVGGTGIGLALVKRIVEIHGGRIWVESDGAGRGCTMRFTMPPAA